MHWLYPGILWALALIAVPIIIHFFYFRRYKTEYFSDIRFLKVLKKETNRFNRLRNLLALLFRIFVIIALVLAFAQPFLNREEQYAEDRAVSIYIDNSYSMSAEIADVSLLDLAKVKTKEIIEAYSEEDAFQVISNNRSGKEQVLLSKEEALEYVQSIDFTAETVPLGEIYNRQKEVLNGGKQHEGDIFWLTDLQKSSAQVKFHEGDSLKINLVPIQSTLSRNVTIDSAWFENPVHVKGRNSKLLIQLTNYGDQPSEAVRVGMNYMNERRPIGTYNLEAGESVLDTISVPIKEPNQNEDIESKQWRKIELNNTDYPVQFDDRYYLSFQVKNSFDILAINSKSNSYLDKLFVQSSEITLNQQRLNALDYSRFEQTELIILDDLAQLSSGLISQLIQYLEGGGKVLLFPDVNTDVSVYNALLRKTGHVILSEWQNDNTEVSNINLREPLFEGVFSDGTRQINLPSCKGHFGILTPSKAVFRWLMKFRDESDALLSLPIGKGQLYLSTFSLDIEQGNLVQLGEIFVPMVYNMTVQSGDDQKFTFTIGKEGQLETSLSESAEEKPFRFISEDGAEIIPVQRRVGKKLFVGVSDGLERPGFYELNPASEGGNVLVAMNFGSLESDLTRYMPEEFVNLMGGKIELIGQNVDTNLSTYIESRNSGNWLWKYFLLAALVFLLLESFLLRFR